VRLFNLRREFATLTLLLKHCEYQIQNSHHNGKLIHFGSISILIPVEMRACWEGEMRRILLNRDEVKKLWIIEKDQYGVQTEKMPLMKTLLHGKKMGSGNRSHTELS
jgi:hypothetical protein